MSGFQTAPEGPEWGAGFQTATEGPERLSPPIPTASDKLKSLGPRRHRKNPIGGPRTPKVEQVSAVNLRLQSSCLFVP
jgi:hypothetical protein